MESRKGRQHDTESAAGKFLFVDLTTCSLETSLTSAREAYGTNKGPMHLLLTNVTCDTVR